MNDHNIYVLRAEEPSPGRNGLSQTRVYSNRDEAFNAFRKLRRDHPDIWSELDAPDIDDHRDWFFEEPGWRQRSIEGRSNE